MKPPRPLLSCNLQKLLILARVFLQHVCVLLRDVALARTNEPFLIKRAAHFQRESRGSSGCARLQGSRTYLIRLVFTDYKENCIYE